MNSPTSPLEKVAWEILFEPEQKSHHYITLYHYTNAEAKSHIVDGRKFCFRLTQADKFADKNEGLLVLERYRYICEKIHNENKIDCSFYNAIKDFKPLRAHKYFKTPWIFCATANGCSSYMKQRYAPNDGCILAFQSRAFELFTVENCLVYEYEVIYSKKKIESRLEAILLQLFNAYSLDENPAKTKMKILKQSICHKLFELSFLYKSAEYSGEEEVRLIIYISEKFTQWNENGLRLFLNPEDKKLYLSMDEQYYYNVDSKMYKSDSKQLNKCVTTSDEIRKVCSKT